MAGRKRVFAGSGATSLGFREAAFNGLGRHGARVWPATAGGGISSAAAVVSCEQIRQLALPLPEVVERDHHGRPSFRVAGRIFATLWDERHVNVMLDEPGIRTVVQANPANCQEFWWGKRLCAVHVDLSRADPALAYELLVDAWEQKAPKRLLKERGASPPAWARRDRTAYESSRSASGWARTICAHGSRATCQTTHSTTG